MLAQNTHLKQPTQVTDQLKQPRRSVGDRLRLSLSVEVSCLIEIENETLWEKIFNHLPDFLVSRLEF